MTKKELIKELELLADSCDSNYALELNAYNRGVLDALDVVNKYFALAPVMVRSEQLPCSHCGRPLKEHSKDSKLCPDRMKNFEQGN